MGKTGPPTFLCLSQTQEGGGPVLPMPFFVKLVKDIHKLNISHTGAPHLEAHPDYNVDLLLGPGGGGLAPPLLLL